MLVVDVMAVGARGIGLLVAASGCWGSSPIGGATVEAAHQRHHCVFQSHRWKETRAYMVRWRPKDMKLVIFIYRSGFDTRVLWLIAMVNS